MAVFLQGVCILSFIAVISSLSEAMVCLMGQEPDSNVAHRYRWVIPVEDPCKCTGIRPGGLNNRTPGRNFKVIYFDTFLISNSPKEIRKWLNCSDAFPGNSTSSISAAIIGNLTFSVPASHAGVVATQATNSLTTREKPVTSFNCVGRDNGGLYADPNDLTMFYQCDRGTAYHRPCPDGTHFSETEQQCVSPA